MVAAANQDAPAEVQQSAAAQPAVNWGDSRLPENFWRQTSPCPTTGCWFWIGETSNSVPVYRGGGRVSVTAKRFAYVSLIAPVERYRRVHSTCDLDVCCNPLHARVTTAPRRDYDRDRAKAYNDRTKDKRKLHWLRTYGLDPNGYARMLEDQSGRCASCLKPFAAAGSNRPCIDHCHATGRVRGLLCSNCNTGIGFFRDSPAALRAAADYLERHTKAAK